MNVEGDRLSSLPDDLIHKILGLIDIKQAIETSGLSSRWRYIWTSMPCLNFSNKNFHTFCKFSKFVTDVMSGRNKQTEVSSVDLTFCGKLSQPFVKRILNIILNYESSHNIQHLNIVTSGSNGKKIESPFTLFSSQSIKHLTLTGCTYRCPDMTAQLPNLTTLNLHRLTFNHDKFFGLFSNFANLKNLTLKHCYMMGLNIHHPKLSNLTLENGRGGGDVVTPQLKNLTLKHWSEALKISAPNLVSLRYKDCCYPSLLSDELLHLEKVDICTSRPPKDKENDKKIVCLLQQLRCVKFLTLNLEIIKCLSLSLELISHQPSPFANLKSLMIYPTYITLQKQTQPEVTMPIEVKNYLLDGSPDAAFTMVSHEEISAVKDATSARNLMIALQVLLDQWKENSETNTRHLMQDKAQPDREMKLHSGGRMMRIKRYWGDLNEHVEKGYKNTCRIISMLLEIEAILTKLPTSYQAKLQARFVGLYEKVVTVMDNAMDRTKIQCDKRPRL